jgi:hypothetical protein
VGGREHRDHLRFAVHLGLCVQARALDIGPERPVRHHYALRETGSTGSVVDQGEFVRTVLIVIQAVRREALGELLPEVVGKALAGFVQIVVAAEDGLQVLEFSQDKRHSLNSPEGRVYVLLDTEENALNPPYALSDHLVYDSTGFLIYEYESADELYATFD